MLLLSGFFTQAQSPKPTWKQLGTDLIGDTIDDQFGETVAISGDGKVIAIASQYHFGNFYAGGQIKVFKYLNNQWTQLGSDLLGDMPTHYMGWALALNYDGSVLVHGSGEWGGVGQTRTGLAEILKWDGQNWNKEASINRKTQGIRLGYSVDIDSVGTSVIIGQPHFNSLGSGRAFVYHHNGNNWTQKGAGLAYYNSSDWGYAVCISADGSTVAVGGTKTPDSLNQSNGACAVYDFDETNNQWEAKGKILFGTRSREMFGASLALSRTGSRLVVGASANTGRVYSFDWDGTSWKSISPAIKGLYKNLLGTSIDLSYDGSIMLLNSWKADTGQVQDCGKVQAVKWNGNVWEDYSNSLHGDSTKDYLGYRAAFSADGKRLITGLHGSNIGGENRGVARVFELEIPKDTTKDTTTWVQANAFNYSELKVFPNPAHSHIEVISENEIRSIAIYSLSGKMVYENFPSELKKQVSVDINKIPSGLYIMRVWSGEKVEQRKVRVARSN